MSRLKSLSAFFSAARVRRLLPYAAGAVLMATATMANARLPDPPAATSGNIMEQFRDYIGLSIGLVALVLTSYAFISVSGGAIAKFNEWRVGKAELGDLKMTFVIGALLLLLVIYLISQVVTIIPSTLTFTG